VTDGRKRALRIFGPRLGNCLANKDHVRAVRTAPRSFNNARTPTSSFGNKRRRLVSHNPAASPNVPNGPTTPGTYRMSASGAYENKLEPLQRSPLTCLYCLLCCGCIVGSVLATHHQSSWAPARLLTSHRPRRLRRPTLWRRRPINAINAPPQPRPPRQQLLPPLLHERAPQRQQLSQPRLSLRPHLRCTRDHPRVRLCTGRPVRRPPHSRSPHHAKVRSTKGPRSSTMRTKRGARLPRPWLVQVQVQP